MSDNAKRLAAIQARYDAVGTDEWFFRETNAGYLEYDYEIWNRAAWKNKLDPIAYMSMYCGQEEKVRFIVGAHRDIPFLLKDNADLRAKLAAYEDTGLAPEEIVTMKAVLTRRTWQRDALLEILQTYLSDEAEEDE